MLYQLSYAGLEPAASCLAPGEGLEPPTTLVNSQPLCQLSYPGMVSIRPGQIRSRLEPPGGTPNGIRTRVTCLKGERPRPLDDGGMEEGGGVDPHADEQRHRLAGGPQTAGQGVTLHGALGRSRSGDLPLTRRPLSAS